MSSLRIKLKRDKLDEMFVYRICNTNDDVARQLLRVRHLQCFVDFHIDLPSGLPACKKPGSLTVAGRPDGLGSPRRSATEGDFDVATHGFPRTARRNSPCHSGADERLRTTGARRGGLQCGCLGIARLRRCSANDHKRPDFSAAASNKPSVHSEFFCPCASAADPDATARMRARSRSISTNLGWGRSLSPRSCFRPSTKNSSPSFSSCGLGSSAFTLAYQMPPQFGE